MNEITLQTEYVGSTFEGENGYTIRFSEDGRYVTNRNQSGRYEILPGGKITMMGDPDTSLTTPDDVTIDRSDLGMTFTVEKLAGSFIHTLDGTSRSGQFRKTE